MRKQMLVQYRLSGFTNVAGRACSLLIEMKAGICVSAAFAYSRTPMLRSDACLFLE